MKGRKGFVPWDAPGKVIQRAWAEATSASKARGAFPGAGNFEAEEISVQLIPVLIPILHLQSLICCHSLGNVVTRKP